MFTTQERESIAYHEAGHAVVAHVLGLKSLGAVTFTEAQPDDEDGGMAGVAYILTPFDKRGSKAWVRRRIIADMAGPMAETRADGVVDERGWCSDVRNAAARCRSAGFNESEIESAAAEAAQLVERHWSAITRLAKRMIERVAVDHDDIAASLRPQNRLLVIVPQYQGA